ncbi:MAG: extracellular solute-binding protein [Treponema sp.]|nr:extracellular solute-binding protein [Treponema sp.]MCL2272068.1 extracellular solute-binding protein [Treponema sp.]
MLKRTGQIGLILFALILVMSMLVFTGCGSKGVKLKGADIKVSSWWSTWNVDTFEPRNEGEEKDLEWRRKILSENDFKFEVVELSDYDNYLPLVASNIMAGNKTYGIYEVAANMAVTLYKQGLLYPVSDSTAVNFKTREPIAEVTPMYNGVIEQLMTFNGKQYGWQYGLPNNGWQQAMIFFNTKHLTDVGLSPDYLYDLQKNNNWTWDTFLDVCRKLTRDTNNDGITDIYALPCDDAREVLIGLVYGNGANFVSFDASGKAVNATNTPAFLEALAFYNTLINEGLILTTPSYDWGWNWTAFYDQRVAMTFDPEWRKGQAQDQFDGGYVLPPRGPRSSQLRMDSSDPVYVVPAIFSPSEVDVILKASELWFTPTDTDWLQGHYWASRNLRDVTETVAMSRDARYLTPRNFALIPGYPFDDFINDFRNGLGNTNPSQVVESWTPRFQASLDDFNR